MRRSAAPSQLQAAKRPRFMTPLLKPPGGNQSQIHVNSPAHKNGAQVGPKSKTFPSVGSQIAKTLLSESSTITTLPNPDYSAGASLSKPVYNARVRPSESVTGFSAGSSLPKPGSSTGATMSNSKLDCSSSSLMSKPAFNTNSSVSKPYFSDNGPLSTLDCNVSVSLPKPHFSGSASLPKSGCSTTSPEAQPGFTVSSSAPKPELSASSSVPHPDCSTIPSVPHSDCSTISSVPCSDCSTISLVPNPGCYDSPSFSKPDCSAGSSLPKADSSPSASLSKPDFSSSSPLSAGSSSTSSASLPIAKPDFSVGCNDFWENSQSQSDSSQKDPDLSQKPESQDNQTLQENINCTSLFRPGCHVENNGTDSNVNINGKEDISGTTDQVIKESRQTRARAARHKGFKAPTLRGPPSKLPNSTSTVIPASENGAQNAEPCEKYFNVMWCKASKKKHKKWEGDAVLVTRGRSVSLIDMDGKEIGKGGGYKISELQTLSEGQTLLIQGKEIEVMGILGEEDFKSGRCFQAAGVRPSPSSGTPAPSGGGKKPFVNPQGPGKKRKATGTKAGASNRAVGPRFDPEAPDALVMPRPTQAHQWEYNKNNLAVVDVVVDPHLALHLRPHQRDGVIFLYKCIMGMKPYLGRGAILADEMGLGKTLQCISLIWTLYKQGPYGGAPVLKRILIITPGSLVKNWSKEFKKWLGNERLSVFAVGPDHKAEEFIKCTIYPVMIISYEMFIRNIDVIKQVRFDMVVCDEGHRLKNTNIKTTSYVNSLNIQKRILLTGTPVQNDLQELYSLVELCNPGILGSLSAFRHVYEDPILASRQPNSDEAAKLLGESRAGELNRLTSLFILRRTQEINNKYLPPKVDMVLFCKPSSLQVRLYQQFIRSRTVLSYLSSSDSAKHLMCIAALKKLCNHPTLIYKQNAGTTGEDDFEDQYGLYQAVNPLFPEGYDPAVPETGESGKLQVLAGFLSSLSQTQERIVLVSNYTQTLNVLEHLCVTNNYQYLRLDGQTPTAKRQQLVERFNSKYSKDFVFLLSSKAGGVGLNLIGASRLVLYDIDWNPANDLQAMARVWRDGQKRRVHIYRLVTTGTLEEKIYQRQITKQGLSGTVVDAKTNAKLTFSPEDLRDLFKLDEDTLCSTHELLKCPCSQTPGQSPAAVSDGSLNRPCQLLADKTTNTQRNMCMSELLEWQHVPGPKPDLSHVDPLLTEHTDNITYVFWCESNTAASQC